MVYFRYCEKCGKRFQPTGKSCKQCNDCKSKHESWLRKLFKEQQLRIKEQKEKEEKQNKISKPKKRKVYKHEKKKNSSSLRSN